MTAEHSSQRARETSRTGAPIEETRLNPDTIRVGIVGAGNCASSFVQGLHYYRDAEAGDVIPGLMNPCVGRYRVSDVCISAAFDVNANKVGIALHSRWV